MTLDPSSTSQRLALVFAAESGWSILQCTDCGHGTAVIVAVVPPELDLAVLKAAHEQYHAQYLAVGTAAS